MSEITQRHTVATIPGIRTEEIARLRRDLPRTCSPNSVTASTPSWRSTPWGVPQAPTGSPKRLLTTFFDICGADDSLYTYHPMEFRVDLGYPTTAHLVLVGMTVIIRKPTYC